MTVRHSIMKNTVALSLLALASCSGLAQRDAPLREMDTLIGTASCSADAQCRVIGVGARPCGGPESYRAWSTLVTSEPALVAAAEAYATERREADRKIGAMSTCEILPEPTVSCIRGACTLQQGPTTGGRNLR